MRTPSDALDACVAATGWVVGVLRQDGSEPKPSGAVAVVGGVNIHAGPPIDGRDRRRLERLCRYVARPPIAQDRLKIVADGRVRLEFKRAWKEPKGMRRRPVHGAPARHLGRGINLPMRILAMFLAPLIVAPPSPHMIVGGEGVEQPEPSTSDRVTRRDGSIVEGKIVELTPKEQVVIELGDGGTVEVEWVEIQEIIRDGKVIAQRKAKPEDADARAEPGEQACQPDCRSGFACVEGTCVSACNPACDPGDTCTDEGECVSPPQPTASTSSRKGLDAITRRRLRLQRDEGERQRKAGGALMAIGGVGVLLGVFIGATQFARRDTLLGEFSSCSTAAINQSIEIDQDCLDIGFAAGKAEKRAKGVIGSFTVIGSLLIIGGGAAFGVGTGKIKNANARLGAGVSTSPNGAALTLYGRF